MLTLTVNEIKCGDYTKESFDPFEHNLIFYEALGITNYTIMNAVNNYNKSTEFCSLVPTTGILCVIIIALEFTRLITVTVTEIRKKFHQQNRVNNFPPPGPPPQNNLLNSLSLHLPRAMNSREIILTPKDVYMDMASNCSAQEIHIIEIDEINATTNEDNDQTNVNTSTIQEIVSPTTNIAFPTEEIVAPIADTSVQIEATASDIEETSPRNEETAMSTHTPQTAAAFPEDPSSLAVNDKSTLSIQVHPRTRTVADTVINTLRLSLFRSGTLVVLLILMGLLTWIPLYIYYDDKLSIYPRIMLRLIIRFVNFLLPLVWILVESEIRIYTFLKLRQMWLKLSNTLVIM